MSQMFVRALRARQMSNQIPGRPVKVHAFEVVNLLSLEIEDFPADYLANMEAIAVEDISVHGWPPLSWSRPDRRDKVRQPILNSEIIQAVAPLFIKSPCPDVRNRVSNTTCGEGRFRWEVLGAQRQRPYRACSHV
jgi:hypothetical protein